jgi:hypothetical protein
MLIIQAHGSHVENGRLGQLYRRGGTHQVSKPAAEPKEEQAASRPLTIRTEKAVRKLTAPPDSSGEVWMVWARNATMLVLGGQGTWGRFSCYGQAESAEAAGAEHGLAGRNGAGQRKTCFYSAAVVRGSIGLRATELGCDG